MLSTHNINSSSSSSSSSGNGISGVGGQGQDKNSSDGLSPLISTFGELDHHDLADDLGSAAHALCCFFLFDVCFLSRVSSFLDPINAFVCLFVDVCLRCDHDWLLSDDNDDDNDDCFSLSFFLREHEYGFGITMGTRARSRTRTRAREQGFFRRGQ